MESERTLTADRLPAADDCAAAKPEPPTHEANAGAAAPAADAHAPAAAAIPATLTVCQMRCRILRLLGHGKGGYSYLAEADHRPVVLKQIHHEPCAYYSFGDKLTAELRDYERLRAAGIRVPTLLAVDREAERIVKEYIEGPTVFELVRDGKSVDQCLIQVRTLAALAMAAGLNIDYFPTNFVLHDGLLWYVDYECNDYMEAWSFAHWGVKYWSRTPEFDAYLQQSEAADTQQSESG